MSELVAVFNDLKLLSNGAFQIRYLKHEGEFYFKAFDIASGLGYVKPDKAVRDIVKEKYKRNFNILGEILTGPNWGGRNSVYISLAGVCQFSAQSKMPAAERFQDWVFEEVLPSIMQTGKYEVDDFEKFKAIAEGVTLASDNAAGFKKISDALSNRLKDEDKVENGRKGGLQAQQNIRAVKKELAEKKKELRQTKIDLTMFKLTNKLVAKCLDP